MSNFIRGVFCLAPYPFEFKKVSDLFTTLRKSGIRLYPQNTDTVTGSAAILKQITDGFAREGYLKIDLQWELRETIYKAHFEFTGKHDFRKFVFCVDEQAFLPGNNISYVPADDPIFESYKRAIVIIIKSLRPNLGVIDYENDFLCGPDSPMSSWGNYIPFSIQGSTIDRIKSIVSDYTVIDDAGILTFIHPLQANQAWTEQHKELQSILIGL